MSFRKYGRSRQYSRSTPSARACAGRRSRARCSAEAGLRRALRGGLPHRAAPRAVARSRAPLRWQPSSTGAAVSLVHPLLERLVAPLLRETVDRQVRAAIAEHLTAASHVPPTTCLEQRLVQPVVGGDHDRGVRPLRPQRLGVHRHARRDEVRPGEAGRGAEDRSGRRDRPGRLGVEQRLGAGTVPDRRARGRRGGLRGHRGRRTPSDPYPGAVPDWCAVDHRSRAICLGFPLCGRPSAARSCGHPLGWRAAVSLHRVVFTALDAVRAEQVEVGPRAVSVVQRNSARRAPRPPSRGCRLGSRAGVSVRLG